MLLSLDDLPPHVERGLEEIASAQRARGRIWRIAQIAEAAYAIKLRKVAAQVGVLIQGFSGLGEDVLEMALRAYGLLHKYADILDPWARSAAQQLITEVAARNRQSWFRAAEEAGADLQQQIIHAPIESTMQELVRSQVGLIKSIPLEAAQRVQTLAIEGTSSGARYADIIADIMRTGEVAKWRATMIARTEVARAGTALTQARAQAVGSSHYSWVSAHDGSVRPMHRKLDAESRAGKTFAWDDPPVAEENGARHAPGQFPNCRCIAVPVIVPAYWRI